MKHWLFVGKFRYHRFWSAMILQMLEVCGIEGKIQFLVLMTPYPTYKIQINKKRGAQTDQNSVSSFFYAFFVFDYSDGYVQLHCL